MYKLSAVFIGLLIAIMVTFNGILAKNIGDYLSVLIVHIVGLTMISFILVIRKKKIKFKENIPIYLFSAGAIGVFLVFFNNVCFKYLGVSLTLSLGLFGQSVASGIIDHFGLLGMNVNKFQREKLIGFTLILIGIIIMLIY
ncbi:DMT family transporter [Clostridium aestuarii]|uniref:DMT family transporter n=1 Tax=Clostridium aestuarii TaxID=338193 RepID=A0ABT4CVP9_9CLOT|nr:DMT family transporter [Clostridium aestuarii]MCY6483063.1 DMT family transporter [Clostridium aestuarii]